MNIPKNSWWLMWDATLPYDDPELYWVNKDMEVYYLHQSLWKESSYCVEDLEEIMDVLQPVWLQPHDDVVKDNKRYTVMYLDSLLQVELIGADDSLEVDMHHMMDYTLL